MLVLAWLFALQDAAATGDPLGQHHSTARQVTPANVGELEVAWTHRYGDMAAASGEPSSVSAQSTPILLPRAAGEHLVYCTPFNRIIALDPQTGAPRATRTRSVSVIADSCMAADAGATVAFACDDASRVLARHGARVAHMI